MKCGVFPLRAKYPVLKETREMYHAIVELRDMATDAVANVRQSDKNALSKLSKNKIFEIHAK